MSQDCAVPALVAPSLVTRARRRRRHFAFALAALISGLIVTVVAGEVAVRVLGVTSAPRRHFRPGIYAPDPELGWVLRPDFKGVHVEYAFEAPTTTDALGYRGPAWDATRAASSVRVLALGDSCTFGRGVGDAETWPARLEARLRADGVDAAVYDAGVPGYDTVQEEVAFGRILPIVRPTHVVIGWLPNDVLERSVDTRPRTQVLDGHLIDDVERYQEWKDQIEGRGISGSALYRFLRMNLKLVKHALSQRHGAWDRFAIPDEALAFSQGSLARIAARAREAGARPILLLVPRQEEVEPPLPGADHYARMAAFAGEQGVDIVDIPAAWRAPGGLPAGELYLPRDEVHFTPLGYDLIAEAVADRIRECSAPDC